MFLHNKFSVFLPLTRIGRLSPKREKDRYDLQKEVLNALFTAPERTEKAPRLIRPMREVRRRKLFGKVVEPLVDTTTKTVNIEQEATEEGIYLIF